MRKWRICILLHSVWRLLFVPRRAPVHVFETNKKPNFVLYVRRGVAVLSRMTVLIPERLNFCEGLRCRVYELIPEWLKHAVHVCVNVEGPFKGEHYRY